MGTTAAPTPGEGARHEALEKTWGISPGIIGWLSQTNHKDVATRYIVTSLVFFVLAGLAAVLMRIQLARPELEVISPQLYNQLFTTHGTTMMFLFAVPILEAVGMYIVPLMIGARDMAFPRLNAFGYWVYLFAGASVWIALFSGNGPDAAWFNYVPLSSGEYSPGIGIDIWTTAISFIEVAALVAAVELIVTIFKMRSPGMSLNRMPLFVWAILVTAFMILFAMPAVMLASVMLVLDRVVGTHFYNPLTGGDPLLWQHLFWIFGHPEVYIVLLPALGIVSAIVATYARRQNSAYTLVAMSMVAVGFFSFGLWVHHMFTTGLPGLSLSFFAAASMMIAIPSGIQVFSWIATLWGTRPKFDTPFLFVIGFFFIFVLGGITGVMVAAIPFNEQVHDTYFVVAHFHYVLIGGAVFPLFAGIHYWYPKLVGRMLSEYWGKISFWMLFISFNLTFFPMHYAGMMGMPRQVYTYRAGLGWDWANMVSTLASFVFAAGVGVLLLNAIVSKWRGAPAPNNPWGGGTLEWATSSPPLSYNFEHLPYIERRYPLWNEDQVGPADPDFKVPVIDEDAIGSSPHLRESVVTRLLDGKLEHRVIVASPSIWPFFAAIAVAVIFLGILVSLWFAPIGVVLAYVAFIGWLWPRKEEWQQ